jgi:hypothetical protein
MCIDTDVESQIRMHVPQETHRKRKVSLNPSACPLQEAIVRPMRNFFNPVVGATPEVTEVWKSEPNPGLSESRSVDVFTGSTLGGSSAVNGAQFSTPTLEVRHPIHT